MISTNGSSIYDFPQGKLGVPDTLLEVGLCLPMSDFLDIRVNVGSSEPSSSSQLVVGDIFTTHSPASSSASIPMMGQAGKMNVPKLLGGIGDVLDDGFSTLGQKERAVMPSSSKASPSPFVDSLTVDPDAYSVLGGALGVS
ncbi:unnamed protein product [Lactuca saligna]|uniref:Uncharacterized protein n=1 Tax=Lactuca saligna TaxID=75948 RepID=A0AA35Z6L2_LACSI|nr:unnamed protein product [Lactuca saligna]